MASQKGGSTLVVGLLAVVLVALGMRLLSVALLFLGVGVAVAIAMGIVTVTVAAMSLTVVIAMHAFMQDLRLFPAVLVTSGGDEGEGGDGKQGEELVHGHSWGSASP